MHVVVTGNDPVQHAGAVRLHRQPRRPVRRRPQTAVPPRGVRQPVPHELPGRVPESCIRQASSAGLNVGVAQYLRDLPRRAHMRVHHAVDERHGPVRRATGSGRDRRGHGAPTWSRAILGVATMRRSIVPHSLRYRPPGRCCRWRGRFRSTRSHPASTSRTTTVLLPGFHTETPAPLQYVRPSGRTPLVIAVLHERMDLPARLKGRLDPLRHQAVDRHRTGLADAMGAARGLVLRGRIPSRIHVDHVVDRGQVQSRPARPEREQFGVAIDRLVREVDGDRRFRSGDRWPTIAVKDEDGGDDLPLPTSPDARRDSSVHGGFRRLRACPVSRAGSGNVIPRGNR